MQTDQLQNISDQAARSIIEALIAINLDYRKQLDTVKADILALAERVNQIPLPRPAATPRENK